MAIDDEKRMSTQFKKLFLVHFLITGRIQIDGHKTMKNASA